MLQYPTPADLHYGDVADSSIPQGSSQWGPGRSDSSHPAVNPDADDRQRAQQQRASQSLPTNYSPATAYTSRDSYPAQAQSHYSGPYSQPYPSSSVNYVQPPYDFGEYPVSRALMCDQTEYSPTIIRSMQSTPTPVDIILPMQLIHSILLPLILCLSTPMSMRGTSPRTALYAPHSRVNISTAWYLFLPATRPMMIVLVTMSTMLNSQPHQFSHPPAPPSSAMLSWRPLRQSLSRSITALLPFLAFPCRLRLLNMNYLRPWVD